MQLLPLNTLGAHEIAPHRVQFGLFLPWVSAQDTGDCITITSGEQLEEGLRKSRVFHCYGILGPTARRLTGAADLHYALTHPMAILQSAGREGWGISHHTPP